MNLDKMLELRSGIHKRRGNAYTNTVRKLHALVEERLGQAAQLEAVNAQLLMQEQVLADLVEQQECHLQLRLQLELDISSHAAYEAELALERFLLADSSCHDYCCPHDSTEPARSMPNREKKQYCHQLLMSATREQWEQAARMTAREWSEYYEGVVWRITVDDLMAALYKMVDDLVVATNLSMLQDSISFREMLLWNHLTKKVTPVVDQQYWKRVVTGMKLTQAQVNQLRLMHGQFWKILGTVHKQQEKLVQEVAESTCPQLPVQVGQAAAGDLRAGSSHQAEATGDSSCHKISSRVNSKMWGAVEATMAATKKRDIMESQLCSHMSTWRVGSLLQLQYICNTFTRLQLVELVTGSYPFFPRPASVLAHIVDPTHPAAGNVPEKGPFERLLFELSC
eukprot:gene4134-4383_t